VLVERRARLAGLDEKETVIDRARFAYTKTPKNVVQPFFFFPSARRLVFLCSFFLCLAVAAAGGVAALSLGAGLGRGEAL